MQDIKHIKLSSVCSYGCACASQYAPFTMMDCKETTFHHTLIRDDILVKRNEENES